MMSKVYTLKHATPRMKYSHMVAMMAWKADFQERQAAPLDRDTALDAIKGKLGSETFHTWYNEIYSLRREGRQQEYEDAIFKKLKEIAGQTEQTETQ